MPEQERKAFSTGLRSLPPQKEAFVLTVITLLTQLMKNDDPPEPAKKVSQDMPA